LQKKKKKSTERGSSIKVPDDNFFELLKSGFRLQNPDTSYDRKIIESVSDRLRRELGEDGVPNLDKAQQLICAIQSKLLKHEKKRQRWIHKETSLALGLDRLVLGLVAFSATDRDLAKLYRSLQGVHPKQSQVSALIRLGDELRSNVQWQHDKILPEWHKRVSESDPRLIFVPIYTNEIKKAVKTLKSASQEDWETDVIRSYGSSGRVARVYLNRCFWLLQNLMEELSFRPTELFDLYKYLGAKPPTLKEGAKFKNNPKYEVGSPITQYLKLKFAKTVADIFKR